MSAHSHRHDGHRSGGITLPRVATRPGAAFRKGFMKGFKRMGHYVSAIINTVLLSIVYLVDVGVTSIISRLAGKRFLDTKLDKRAKKSYWETLDIKKRPIESHYKQF